jgi:hypothetical protein
MTINARRSSSRAARRPSWASRFATGALVAVVLAAGGQIARAGAAADAVVATAPKGAGASPAAPQTVSSGSVVAQAEAALAAGHPGRAILDYQRARLLAPRAPAVTAGLTRAESLAGLPREDASPAVRAARRLDANEWGWLAMAGLTLGAAGVVALSWGLIGRRGLLALGLAGVGLAGVGLLGAVEVAPGPNRAVVVAPDTVARIAPFAQADQAFSVPEGSVVTVERTYDHYSLIAGADGRGWVPEGGLELILPAAGKRS